MGSCWRKNVWWVYKGKLTLNKPTQLFAIAGSMGQSGDGSGVSIPGGCNGGGNGYSSEDNGWYHSGGGGASHVAALVNDNAHRILVAGGGGGCVWGVYLATGGGGGGTKGTAGELGDEELYEGNGLGGNQTHPGEGCGKGNGCPPGGFGSGGNVSGAEGSGGGGGWFGGAGSGSMYSAGGGGSGFAFTGATGTGCSQIDNHSLLEEGFPPLFDTYTETGNNGGDGAVIITYLSLPSSTVSPSLSVSATPFPTPIVPTENEKGERESRIGYTLAAFLAASYLFDFNIEVYQTNNQLLKNQ